MENINNCQCNDRYLISFCNKCGTLYSTNEEFRTELNLTLSELKEFLKSKE